MFQKLPTTSDPHDADQPSPKQGPNFDLELVHSILEKRRERLVEFLDRLACIPRILHARNRAMGRPLDDSELDDVAQDSLSVVWRKLPKFEGRSSLETWTYRIVVFELMNAIRRRSRRRWQTEGGTALLDAQAPSVEPFEDYSDIYLALDELRPEEASVIRTKHFDNQSFAEIAEKTNEAQSTIKTRYYTGMKRLQVLLQHRKGDLH